MKLKIGDLVKRSSAPSAYPSAGLVVDTGQQWRALLLTDDAGAMRQFVTVLWSGQTSACFEWSDSLDRFDPHAEQNK